MISIRIKPSRSIFGGRGQWKFEIQAANGKRIDPRDTYANRGDIIDALRLLVTFPGGGPVELEIQDRYGQVEERRLLR